MGRLCVCTFILEHLLIGLHEIKSFFIAKEMVTIVKIQLTKWEKIFSSYTSDKGLITRIYRNLKKLNSQRINDPMKKLANELNRNFSKEKLQMAKKKNPWP
jgi:hypothetical protein